MTFDWSSYGCRVGHRALKHTRTAFLTASPYPAWTCESEWPVSNHFLPKKLWNHASTSQTTSTKGLLTIRCRLEAVSRSGNAGALPDIWRWNYYLLVVGRKEGHREEGGQQAAP